MLDWKDAKQNKPVEHQIVLLKIRYEDNPVVGYWTKRWGWGACTVNIRIIGDAYCEAAFDSEDVSHYAEISKLPE